jgi:hypothetical protein
MEVTLSHATRVLLESMGFQHEDLAMTPAPQLMPGNGQATLAVGSILGP